MKPNATATPRVLMLTEGTYPFIVGGVSSWCNLIINGLTGVRWQVMPIVGSDTPETPKFELPDHASLEGPVELWSEDPPRGSRSPRGTPRLDLPAVLARTLLGGKGDHGALVDALVWCRLNPRAMRQSFRSARAWGGFIEALGEVLTELGAGLQDSVEMDALEAATLYQTLYWVGRTAAVSTPETDLLHVTAAGWAAVPALVHKALHGTPLLLTEHGVYVRESYLAAARGDESPGARFISTRLAHGLARATYVGADVISPVTDSNARWECALGVDPKRIRVIYNGVEEVDREPSPLPGNGTVAVIGRIDPLKDVHTTLYVAAEVTRRHPQANFRLYGPAGAGQEAYMRSCEALHRDLGLGERVRFMGSTSNVPGALAEADVYLITSISEALPMAILEAMSHGRPVVATGVGGVADVVRGCGVTTPPGDVHGLSMGVISLLQNPYLAARLGRRGWQRACRTFTRAGCLDGYAELISELVEARAA